MLLTAGTIKMISIAIAVDMLNGSVAYRVNKAIDERRSSSKSLIRKIKKRKR